MDETVGDVPSEGGDSSRRFGIYRAFTPEPRVFNICRLSLLFVACIAGVVVFAVFFPMLQFASRSSKAALPFPEIANNSSGKDSSNANCSSNVLSFGHDCTEPLQTSTEETTVYNGHGDQPTSSITETAQFETARTTLDNDSEVVAETRHVKILRTGRSKWPVTSTPYPYYLPKPTQGITERVESDSEEAIIFAIPSDTNQEDSTSYSNSKPRVNFTPPPYAFTPFPNFTDSYAQLLPYKIPTNHTNFDEILKYLNSNEDKFVSSTTGKPFMGNRRLSTMKVSGTYRMPLDRRRNEDNAVSSSEKTEEARPFFNGHAYIADPFVKFRPSNPIDVNRLVPLRPDIGSRFRRPFPMNVATPLAEIARDTQDRRLQSSYTEAVFHGAGSVAQPSDLLTPPPQDKPLSVTLDIYPVTMEMPVSEDPPKWRERGRFRRPHRPRWGQPATRRPVAQTQPPPPPQPADNHMVVHLNLFPNKRKPYTFPRRGDHNSATPITTPLNADHVGAGARSFTGPLEIERLHDQTRVTTVPFSSTARSWSSTKETLPEFSALTGKLGEEPTTEVFANTSESGVMSELENETNLTVVNNKNKTETSSYDESTESTGFNANTSSLGGIDGKMDMDTDKGVSASLDVTGSASTLAGQRHLNVSKGEEDPAIEYPDVTLEDDVFVSTEPFNDIH